MNKKLLSLIIAIIAIAMPAKLWAQEPYAALSESNTKLTFYYDDKKADRNGMDIGPFETVSTKGWDSYVSLITSVVFDDSFAAYTELTSTAHWFVGCDNLVTITGIENLRTDNVTDMMRMFAYCSNLTTLNLSGLNTSKVNNMSYMFNGCSSLTSLDLSTFNTENVTDMSEMFRDCSSLTSLNLSGFKTTNVTDMNNMFYACSKLTNLDLSSFNTQSVIHMQYMFSNCSSLTSINMSGFNNSNVKDVSYMFYACSSLTSLDLSSFNTANVTDMRIMFSGCTALKSIYVGSGWTIAGLTYVNSDVFSGCENLVGGMGTTYDVGKTDETYAHIDGGPDNPGYFTDINAPAAAQDGDFFTALNADGVLMSFHVLSAADKTCEIYKGYEIAAIDTETSGAMNIPETVKDSLDRQYTVTRIGHYAFLHCKNITEVTTPSTVTSIGNNAFHDCASLTNYDIPAGVTELCDRTFYETHFKHIVIPANITNIMHESFGSSSAITVTSYIQQPFALGENAFGYSTQTATLYVPVGTIDAYKATDGWKDFYRIVENSNIQFADDIVKEICVTNWDKNGDGELSTSEAGAVMSISDVFKKQSISSFDELQYFTGLNKIDNEAFSGCTQLSSVRLPLTITEIGYAAFVDCPITSVEIPSSVTNIGNQAFLGTSLETLSIPSSVTTVGLSAFNATNLKSVNIPATLTSIGQSAFLNYGLESLVVEEGNPVYDSRNNCNALIETSSNTLLTGCNNTVIPETVTSIGEAAFRWMNNLTSITIPASVEHIGNYAFDVSSYLTSIVCEREYAVEAESNIFNDYSYQEATLYVPAAGIQSYNMTSPWNLFQHKETLGDSTEPETYAVLSGDKTTLTFYYDTKKSERNGMDIGPFVNAEERPWHQMRESIENVIFDSAVTNDTTITSTANWLAGFSSLKNIDGLQWLNTSKVTNMEQMFLNCETMETVDLSSFNTSHVTSFNRMFTSCLKLKSLDLNNFNTSEVKGMVSMFSDCSDLSAIYVGNNWDASKVEDSSDMFVGCTNLVGGAGTTYDINHTDATYAHIDGGTTNPGYFTDIVDKDKVVWSVIGTINGEWDTDTEMTSQDGVNYTATFPYMAKNTYEFKIRANGSWNVNYGAEGKQDGQNIAVVVPEDNTGVVINFNADTKEISTSLVAPEYSVAGDFNEWSDSEPMAKDENGVYVLVVEGISAGDHEFKIKTNKSWDVNYGLNGLRNGDNIPFTADGVSPVTFYFDPETKIASAEQPQLDITEAYVVMVSDSVKGMSMTLYYDKNKSYHSEGFATVGLNELMQNQAVLMNRSQVKKVTFDESFANCRPTSTAYWFSEFSSLETIEGIEYLKTDSVTNMSNMFYNCSSLTTLDVTGFNTQNVTNMDGMFTGCSGLKTIYVGESWSTANVKYGDDMFVGCGNLVGGAGTVYDADHVDVTYAHIDGGVSNPGYFTDKNAPVISDDIIQFADANVKAICVTNWDTNGDGELSKMEAAAVTTLGTVFHGNKSIITFDELQHFTGLTTIDNFAFDDCNNLQSVILPNSVTSIGTAAFQSCEKLIGIVLPDGLTSIGEAAFNICLSLTTIDFPNSLLTLEESSFSHCESITAITIPASVTSIGRSVLSGCVSLNTINVAEGNTTYDSRENCNAIIETSTNRLIEGCKSTVIPNSVTAIGYAAFSSCSGLTSLSIPNSVKSIEDYVFPFCTGLTSLTIPNSVTTININSFSGCYGLNTINVEEGNPTYDSRENCNAIIETSTNTLFRGCKATIIPTSVTAIGEEAFSNCNKLTSLTIPNSVTSIASYAFRGCVNLTELISLIEDPMVISDEVFANVNLSKVTLYVPAGKVDAYRKTEGWNKFENIVEMEPAVNYVFDASGVLWVDSDVTMAQVMEKASKMHNVANHITAIVWHSSKPLTNADLQEFDNPNMLIYVASDSLAPQNRNNVVVGDFAKNIVLKDVESGNGSFYCPQAFTAEMISYTHEYKQKTEVGVSRGWETIALPFDVQTIMHEKNGLIAPFGNSTSDKHFWLRQLTHQGLEQATAIQANWPYLISMPNSETYTSSYNLAGRVTFSAQNVVVPETEEYGMDMYSEAGGMVMMRATFSGVSKSAGVYALNVGEARGNNPEGSVFEVNYRDIRPFEAYTMHEGNGPAPRFVPIKDMTNGDTTGIEDVRSLMSDDSGENWYDLNGRKLLQKPIKKGVYLNNGLKVVIK